MRQAAKDSQLEEAAVIRSRIHGIKKNLLFWAESKMNKIVDLLFSILKVIAPMFLIFLLVQKIFGVRLMEKRTIYSSKEKKSTTDKLSKFIAVLSLIATAVTAYFVFIQAKAAKEATIPYLLVSMYNDENRFGLYVTNSGKGHAIIDSIRIDTEKGPEKFEIVTDETWKSVLKKAGIDIGMECFAFSTIQKNIVAHPGSTYILLGRRQSASDYIDKVVRTYQESTNNQRIIELNSLVLQHISNSNQIVNGKDIVEKFDTMVSEQTSLKQTIDKFDNCQEFNDKNYKEEILKKLENINLSILYHSIIDDEIIESKRLKFLTTK